MIQPPTTMDFLPLLTIIARVYLLNKSTPTATGIVILIEAIFYIYYTQRDETDITQQQVASSLSLFLSVIVFIAIILFDPKLAQTTTVSRFLIYLVTTMTQIYSLSFNPITWQLFLYISIGLVLFSPYSPLHNITHRVIFPCLRGYWQHQNQHQHNLQNSLETHQSSVANQNNSIKFSQSIAETDKKAGIFDLSMVLINLDFQTHMWGNLGLWQSFTTIDPVETNSLIHVQYNRDNEGFSPGSQSSSKQSMLSASAPLSSLAMDETCPKRVLLLPFDQHNIILEQYLVKINTPRQHSYILAAQRLALLVYYKANIIPLALSSTFHAQKPRMRQLHPPKDPHYAILSPFSLQNCQNDADVDAGDDADADADADADVDADADDDDDDDTDADADADDDDQYIDDVSQDVPKTPNVSLGISEQIKVLDVGFGCGDQCYFLINMIKDQYHLFENDKGYNNNSNSVISPSEHCTTVNTASDRTNMISYEIYGVNLSQIQTEMAVGRIPLHFPNAIYVKDVDVEYFNIPLCESSHTLGVQDSIIPNVSNISANGHIKLQLQQGSAIDLLPPHLQTPIFSNGVHTNKKPLMNSSNIQQQRYYQPSSFTHVTCIDSIYHFPPKIQFLGDVFTLLKKQGTFVCTDVVLKQEHCKACQNTRKTYTVVKNPSHINPSTTIHEILPTSKDLNLGCIFFQRHTNIILQHISSMFSIPSHNLYTQQEYYHYLEQIGFTEISIHQIDGYIYSQFYDFVLNLLKYQTLNASGSHNNSNVITPLKLFKFLITGWALHHLAKNQLEYVVIIAHKK